MTVNSICLSEPNVSYDHFRMDRISLTAAIPLFAMRTLGLQSATALLDTIQQAYFGDDRVTTLSFDEICHPARWSGLEGVGACKKRSEVCQRQNTTS